MFVENFINVLGVLVRKLLPSFAFIVLDVFFICKLSRGGLIWLGCKGDSLINTNAYEGIRGNLFSGPTIYTYYGIQLIQLNSIFTYF